MQRTQQPVGLKYGYLFKCSQKMKMWDTTWFVLGTQELAYYSRGVATPKTIDLQQTVSIVSADVEDAKRAHSFKLTSPSFPRPLILAAETSEQADEWIAAIRAVSTLYAPPPESPNGPPKLTPDNRNMLDCTMRIVQSTGKLINAAAQATVPGVYSKLLLDNLSMSALMCGTTGRVVVYKPKVQSGGQRFTQSVTETMALVVKYKHTYQSARRKFGASSKAQDPLADVTAQLESLVEVIERTVSNWMPNTLDPELTKPIDDTSIIEDEEEREEREEREKGESNNNINPYVSPFFINPAASPPPCKKHWDLLVDECAGLIAYMEMIAKDENCTYRQASPTTIDQAKLFLTVSRRFHEIPNGVMPEEEYSGLPEDQFSLMKQQLLGSVSSIDYHTAHIGLCADSAPPQIIDIISHAHGISSAITKLPRAIKKHRTKTLVSAIESIGSFSFSLAKLVMQMTDHESFSKSKESRPMLQDEVHAVQYIAIHMMGLCALLIEGEYKTTDILPLTDTAKLLALGVTNTLESLRFQLSHKTKSLSHSNSNSSSSGASLSATSSLNSSLSSAVVDPVTGKPSPRTARRKLESEIKDAATGSMVFWFGMVGQNVCVHLEA